MEEVCGSKFREIAIERKAAIYVLDILAIKKGNFEIINLHGTYPMEGRFVRQS